MEPADLRLTISSRSGSVRVRAEGNQPLQITGAKETVEDGPNGVRIKSTSSTIEVTCPANTSVSVGTASGSVDLDGTFDSVQVVTASGSVRIDEARSTEVRATSSNVRIHRCHGQCRVVTVNGEISVDDAGQVNLRSSSGSVGVRRTESGDVRTVSGSVSVGMADISDHGSIRVQTISSSINILVPRGLQPHSTLHSRTGRVHCDCPDGADGSIDLRSVSGSIRVTEE